MNPAITRDPDPWAKVPYFVLGCSGNAVKLYAVLSRYADNTTREAWPSRKTLADAMGFKQARTMDPLIAELEEAGAIVVYRAKNDQGVNEVNRYHLKGSAPERTTVVRDDAGGSAPPRTRVVRDDALNLEPLNYNQELEPSAPLPGLESVPDVSRETELAVVKAAFDQFWEVWPKKVAKAEAVKVWPKALKSAGQDRIMAGAVRVKHQVDQKLTEPRYLPNPDRWLRNERWQDNEVPASAPNPYQTPLRNSPVKFDHSGRRAVELLNDAEVHELTTMAEAQGRPFGQFTEDEARAKLAERGIHL